MSGACRVREGGRTVEVILNPPETMCVKLRRLCRPTPLCIEVVAFLILLVMATLIFVISVRPCNKDLVIRLKDLAVRDMIVVHNNSTSWHVSSDIDLTLALHNPNSWADCDFPLREVDVSVRYNDSTISTFDLVYQGHDQRSLESSRSHEGSITLTGDRADVSDEAGAALEAQLRRNEDVTFVLDIIARYGLVQRNLNRLVNHKICEVVVKAPQQVFNMRSGDKGFLSAECEEKVTEELEVP